MFKRLAHFLQSRDARTKLQRIEDLFGGLVGQVELSRLGDYESYLRAATGKVWALYKCLDYIACIAIDTPKQVQRKGGSGDVIKNAELDALLAVPNPFETWSEFFYKWVFHFIAAGNAFAAKDQSDMSFNRPKALYLLNPKRMEIAIDSRRGVIGYIYTACDGTRIPYDIDEVVHWKKPHPNKEFWGLGPVEAGEGLFNDAINRQTWSAGFWKNGASPSGILITEEKVADEAAFEKAKAKWQDMYGGAKNSGKTAWLSGKWHYEQLGITAQEMQNLEQSKWTVEQIAHLLGVPLSVLGISQAANFATAEVDDIRCRRDTIKPLLKFAAETLSSDIVEGYGANLELVFLLSGLANVASVAQNMTPLFDRGVVSINEMREAAGFPKITDDPAFDQHFINAGLVPVELAGVADLGATDQAGKRIVGRFLDRSLENSREKN